MDLFDSVRADNRTAARPLAARMRPRTIDEYVIRAHGLGARHQLFERLEVPLRHSKCFLD